MAEIVYVMTNEAMPGIVKIGRTGNIEQRIRELDTTALPLPYECHYAAQVDNSIATEKILHALFSEYRVRANREFFRLQPEKVVIALRLAPHTDATPKHGVFESKEEEQAVILARARRGRIDLNAINVPVGAQLSFSRDDKIKCTVLPENRVDYLGKSMSLSRSALTILQGMGNATSTVSGSAMWMYSDETLEERRQRMESEKFGSQVDD